MALTKTTVRRATVIDAGTDFLTLEDSSNRVAQAVGLVDSDGNHLAFGNNYSSPAAEDSHAFTGATSLGEVLAALNSPGTATAVCAMIFAGVTSLPIDTTVPTWRIPITGGVGVYSFPTGLAVTTGYVVALSSTMDTLTVTTASEGLINVRRI